MAELPLRLASASAEAEPGLPRAFGAQQAVHHYTDLTNDTLAWESSWALPCATTTTPSLAYRLVVCGICVCRVCVMWERTCDLDGVERGAAT